MRIGTIVEGPTDRLLLEAVIDEVCPGDHSYLPLQPADVGSSFGETGTGWKGVRRFCFDMRTQLEMSVVDFIAAYELDLLVIHIDADIASETDLQEQIPSPVEDVLQPCPPIAPTIAKLVAVVKQWLNVAESDHLPAHVVLAIPAQDSENWVFAALFPNDNLCQHDDYECIQSRKQRHPAYQLTLSKYGKILRRKDGAIRKSATAYRPILPHIISNWDEVCKNCIQAQQFHDDLISRTIASFPSS